MISCEEDPTIIGKELLPGNDFVTIESTDTIRPVSYTFYDDSISTDNPGTSYIGQSQDPYFGTTTASFVSQLRLKEQWDGKAYIIDSIKLIMEFSNVKGGTGGTHKLLFREITNDLSTTAKYYSGTPVSYADFTMEVSLPALKEDTLNYVEIMLPDVEFANRLFKDTTMLFHSNNKADFRSYFKGFHVSLNSTGTPMMLTTSLAYTGTGDYIIDRGYKNYFEIFLHDNTGNKRSYYLIFDAFNKNASYNIFNHDLTTADLDKRIQHYNDLSVRDSLSYIQSLNGVYTKIVFPGLEKLKQSGDFDSIAVNKARLTLPYYFDSITYDKTEIPPQIYLRYRTADGKLYNVPDMSIKYDTQYDYSPFLDGSRDDKKMAYHFNIPIFIQDYLNDKKNEFLPELEVYLKRGVRNGILKANSSAQPVKFEFTYTRF